MSEDVTTILETFGMTRPGIEPRSPDADAPTTLPWNRLHRSPLAGHKEFLLIAIGKRGNSGQTASGKAMTCFRLKEAYIKSRYVNPKTRLYKVCGH